MTTPRTMLSEKIFCNKDGEVTRVPIVEHVPPDVTAQIFLLKNRDPAHWHLAARARHRQVRDQRTSQMTEEQWIKERATVIDGEATEVIEDKSDH